MGLPQVPTQLHPCVYLLRRVASLLGLAKLG